MQRPGRTRALFVYPAIPILGCNASADGARRLAYDGSEGVDCLRLALRLLPDIQVDLVYLGQNDGLSGCQQCAQPSKERGWLSAPSPRARLESFKSPESQV